MAFVINALIFFYCVNFGFWFLGYTLEISSISGISAVDFEEEVTTYGGIANSTATTTAFGVENPFGNFAAGINTTWQIGSRLLLGGAMLNVLGNLGLGTAFILPLQVIMIILFIVYIVYLITGRGSEQSA